MRRDQLARQWRILRTIESREYDAAVSELAADENCHPPATQDTGSPVYFEKAGAKPP